MLYNKIKYTKKNKFKISLIFILNLYKKYFLPELIIKFPYTNLYNKWGNVPVFFIFIFDIVGLFIKKLEGYFQTWSTPTWETIAFVETFWLLFFLSSMFSIFLLLRPFIYLTSCLVIFYIYIFISSLYPILGQWIAEHSLGYQIDFFFSIFSFIVGHFFIYKKVFFTTKNKKQYFIFEVQKNDV